MLNSKTIIAALTSALFMPSAFAGTAEDRGLKIAKEADLRDTGFADFKADLVMVLRNRQGQKTVRHLKNRTLEGKDDGDRSIAIFNQPADVKGTAVLTHSHRKDTDDQWLFLPALKRVKRIASSNRSGPFMGSEFAFEDLSSQEVEKYSYKYIKDDTVNGVATFVVERYPRDKKSGYTRQVAWIDKSDYRIQKVDYYDRKSSHLKTLEMRGYKKYLDKYWRPEKMLMVNHQTGKSTLLSWTGYKFRNGFSERDFDKSTLNSAR